MSSRVWLFFTTAFALALITVILTLWAQGYRLNLASRGRLEKTGMILAKSRPDGAKIFLEEKLTSATNATVAGLKPGRYTLRLEKEGFAGWRKEIEVFPELVTEINAVLIPLTPKLLPLTTSEARSPRISPDGQKLAFLNRRAARPGVWLLPTRERNLLPLAQPTPKLVVADRPTAAFSKAQDLSWSPDNSEILLEMNKKGFYLLPTSELPATDFTATATAEPTKKRWQKKEEELRLSLLGKDTLPEGLKETALDPKTLFSPNGRRFLYQKEKEGKREYHVYDLSDPLPVGGQADYPALRVGREEKLTVSWFSDSEHLLLFTCKKEQPCSQASLEIISLDGANRTRIYEGAVAAEGVFPSSDGGELIILTSFNPEAEPNLYAISLR